MPVSWPVIAFAAGAVLIAAGVAGIVLAAAPAGLPMLGAGVVLVAWAASIGNL